MLECGTFAAAASQLNVTPSAISMRMKQLEEHFGKPLFDRSGPHPRPTALALEVVSLFADPMDKLELLRSGRRSVVQGTLTLGIIEAMQPLLLSRLVSWLRQHYPKVELALARGQSTALIASVKSGAIDAAIVARPDKVGGATLQWDTVMSRELVAIAPPASKTQPLASLFRHYDWIQYDRKTTSGAAAASFVHRRIGEVRATMELGSPAAIISMVSAGLGVSVLLVADPALTVTWPVKLKRLGADAPVATISLAFRKLDAEHPTLRGLREALAAIASELPDPLGEDAR
ncbi:LysR family transcriptional regulator [Paraburkholderia tropica]|uniref:LysR family transcriptional regulator n=1 Tax=Paraburkholderia tropica TaxID=92647 RepID=UPI002AB62E3F|nr:LysR family transcriptional regulator [Paraburkholderia tropica]